MFIQIHENLKSNYKPSILFFQIKKKNRRTELFMLLKSEAMYQI